MGFWQIVFLITATAGISIYYWYFSRGLEEGGKQLLKQKLVLPWFLILLVVIQFSKPDYAYYIDTSVTHVDTVEDARLAIQHTNETLERFVQDVRSRDGIIQILLIAFALVFVQYMFGVNSGKNDRVFPSDEKPISIFDNDNK